MVPLTLNCILAYCTGMSLCVSVSVAVKFTLSLLYPFIGFTVIVVGVIVTVRLVVLLVVAYVALPAYSEIWCRFRWFVLWCMVMLRFHYYLY